MNNTKRITAIFIFIIIAYVVTQVAKYYSVSSDNYTPYYLFYAMLLLFYMVLPTKNAKIATATF
jgi:hypothetical protein